MGSGNEAPKYQGPDVKKLQGGSDAYSYSMDILKNGIPEKLRKEYERRFGGAMGGAIRSGEQATKERFASSGGGQTAGAMNDAYLGIRKSANDATTDFYGNLLEKDFGARQTGFGNLSTLTGLAQNAAGMENQYGLEKFKADESGKFKFGDLLGALVGAGGQIGGAAAGRPGKQ